MSRYLIFREVPDRRGRAATRVWDVISVKRGFTLGQVKWFGRWRQYTFFSGSGIVFSPGCLHEVADFVDNATHTHRAARKEERRSQAAGALIP